MDGRKKPIHPLFHSLKNNYKVGNGEVVMVIYLDKERTYPYKEVHGLIDRLLNFVNKQIKGNGEFGLQYLRDSNWLLTFDNDDEITRKAKEESQRLLKETADYIEELSGTRPAWG